MIGRRAVLAVAGTVAAFGVGHASAQQLPRIALVEQGEPIERMVEGGHPWWSALLTALRALGRVDGESVLIDRWTAAGANADGLTTLAARVVESEPDVIVVRGVRAVTALGAATATLPIVGIGTLDGLVAGGSSGSNLTGINVTGGVEIYMKLLQLLHDAVPEAARVAWLGVRDAWEGPIGRATVDAATQLGLTLVPAIIEPSVNESAVRAALSAVTSAVDALYVGSAPEITPHRAIVADLAAAAGLPAIALQREYADAGVMMAYSPDYLEIYRRAADQVDQILSGADPARMLIGQPEKFEFVVNLRTAEALGVTLPPSIMVFATEIIE